MNRMLKATLVVSGLLMACSAVSGRAEAAGKKEHKAGLIDQMSGQGYGMAGCGLGSVIFGQKRGMVQVFAATSNGFFSNNTFGVSSGTLNCPGMNGQDAEAAAGFIETNRLAMENDVARGQGETLEAFYAVVNCEEHKQVGEVLQKNYQQIFKAGATNQDLVTSIRKTIRENQTTANACPKLG